MRTTPLSVALPLAVLATAVAAPPRAHAQPVASEPRNEATTAAPVELARYVPGAVAAEAGAPAATGCGWAGYDGATRTPLVGATADVRLGRRVVLGAGATYAARDPDSRAEVRPSVFARVQILDQTHHGLDLGAAVAYRQDRFVTEEGLLQATLSLGMHGDAGAILMSVGYGQDGEGDDHLGDARLVAFRHLAGPLHLGLDGHVQWLFDSSDPNRLQHGTPALELSVAPAVAMDVGPVMLLVEVGWSGVDFEQLRSGVLALGGVGTSF
jgi:hypothetical protein